MLKIDKGHVAAAMLLTGGVLGWMCGRAIAEFW